MVLSLDTRNIEQIGSGAEKECSRYAMLNLRYKTDYKPNAILSCRSVDSVKAQKGLA